MGHDPEPAPAPRRPVRLAVLAAILFAATAALYWPTCDNDFVNYDDDYYVTANQRVLGGLTFDGLVWAVTTSHASNWHPLTWASLQADADLSGPGPRGFHRTNVLLHAADATLLFLALHALTGAVWRAGAVAALFAVHPQHVESVAWVSERKDVLSAFFFFLTVLLYARYAAGPTPWRMGAVAAALGLGLAAKPMLVTVPCVLLLLDLWPLGRLPLPGRTGDGWWRQARPLLVEKLPLFALAGLAAVLTVAAQSGEAIRTLDAMPPGQRLANAVVSCAAYLGQTVYPTDLAVFYPYPVGGPAAGRVLGALAAVAALTGLAVWQARRRPYLLVGWLWYVGMLVPVIGLVQVGLQARADRYTYLPHVGLFVAVVWGAADLVGSRRVLRVVLAGAFVAAAVGAGVLTRDQIAVWKDGRTLWEHALAVTGDNAEAEAHLADLDLAAGDKATAVARVERALRLAPGKASSEQRVAELLVELDRPLDAIAHYQEAVRLEPLEYTWRTRLGHLLLEAGRLDEAQDEYLQVARIRGSGRAGAIGLGRVCVRRGRLGDAAIMFARGRDVNPTDPAGVSHLGRTLADGGLYEDAAAMYTLALQLKPDDVPAYFERGNMMAARGKWPEAAADFGEAGRRAPNEPNYAFALAHALNRVGRRAEAETVYAAALQLAPDWPEQTARAARRMATSPDPERDLGQRAVHLAEQASEARGGRSAELLDVLAMADAEVGRWTDAVATADRAAARAAAAGRSDLAAQIKSRRDLYADHKPYRPKGAK